MADTLSNHVYIRIYHSVYANHQLLFNYNIFQKQIAHVIAFNFV